MKIGSQLLKMGGFFTENKIYWRLSITKSPASGKRKFNKENSMKYILILFLIPFVFSCNKFDITQTEISAIDKVLDFYGGEVNRSKGFKMKNSEKISYFVLDVSKSDLLNFDQKYGVYHAGNIAYIFYSNLGDEKDNYNEIHVKTNFENAKPVEYIFPVDDLNEYQEFLIKSEEINKLIENKDYANLKNKYLEHIDELEEDLKNFFEELRLEYGEIKGIQIQGFNHNTNESLGKMYYVKEAMIFDKINAGVILVFNRDSKELYSIEFP